MSVLNKLNQLGSKPSSIKKKTLLEEFLQDELFESVCK